VTSRVALAHSLSVPLIWLCNLQSLQEGDEVSLLGIGEGDAKALNIEVHHVQQRRRRAIVEIRRPARPRRIGPLTLPMSAHLPEINARPGSVTT
jgi:hypothetical protein